MKKWLSMLLACLLLLSCAACGEEQLQPEPSVQDEAPVVEPTLEQVKQLVTEGNYEDAYLALQKLKGPEAEAWKKKLVYLPVSEDIEYNDQNLVVRQVSLQFTEEYTYDQNGTLVKEVLTWDDGAVTNYTYEDGKLIKYHSVEGEEVSEGTYTHDDKGNVLTGVFVTHTNEGDRTETATYYYDDQGNEIGYRYFDFLGREFSRMEIYNEQGQHIRTDVVDRSKKITTHYDYDDQGNLIAEREVQHDEEVMTAQYTYDENNRCSSSVYNYSNGTTTHQYYYDEKGNHVRTVCQEEYTDGQDSKHTETNRTYDAYDRVLTCQVRGEEESLTTFDYTSTGYTETTKTGEEEETVKEWKLCYFPEGIPEHMESLQPSYE